MILLPEICNPIIWELKATCLISGRAKLYQKNIENAWNSKRNQSSSFLKGSSCKKLGGPNLKLYNLGTGPSCKKLWGPNLQKKQKRRTFLNFKEKPSQNKMILLWEKIICVINCKGPIIFLVTYNTTILKHDIHERNWEGQSVKKTKT